MTSDVCDKETEKEARDDADCWDSRCRGSRDKMREFHLIAEGC